MIDRVMPALVLVAAVLAVFVPMDYWALVLVLLGLVHGFMSRETDTVVVLMVLVAAVVLPQIADSLDAIPAVGSYLNSIIDNFAIGVAGYAVAHFVWDVWSRVMPGEGSE